jgi:hypothetical protein
LYVVVSKAFNAAESPRGALAALGLTKEQLAELFKLLKVS